MLTKNEYERMHRIRGHICCIKNIMPAVSGYGGIFKCHCTRVWRYYPYDLIGWKLVRERKRENVPLNKRRVS